MVKAIFFDLFFTLIIPTYSKENCEYDILNMSMQEWEAYAEDESLYKERALGLVKSEEEIINRIVEKIPFQVSEVQKEKLLVARIERMKSALQNVSEEAINVLNVLKSKNIKIGLISNADIIDCKYWKKSRLSLFFDEAIFSCNVGLLKPDKRIYEFAMRRLNVMPEECLFVGDGGSNELGGAKSVGMKTIFSEALEVKSKEKRKCIMNDADYYVDNFTAILRCID